MPEIPIKTTSTDTAPAESETETPVPTRLQAFTMKHPRAAKIVAITGAVTAVIGATHIARTVRARKDHLVSAGDHVGEALSEVAASVSPTDDPKA